MELICYLSNGSTSLEDSIDMSRDYVEGGCDIIEIDIPARNPYLEGELISGMMAKALQNCDDYDKYLEQLAKVKKINSTTKFILLAYEETVKEIGVDKFINFCLENSYLDLILVGLENDTIKKRLMESGIKVSCYIQFNMQKEEIENAMATNGFVYLQAKPVGIEKNPNFPTLSSCIAHLRNDLKLDRPIYCGVGIYTSEDIKMAREAGANAVFVGSTILKLYNDRKSIIEKIRELKNEC